MDEGIIEDGMFSRAVTISNCNPLHHVRSRRHSLDSNPCPNDELQTVELLIINSDRLGNPNGNSMYSGQLL